MLRSGVLSDAMIRSLGGVMRGRRVRIALASAVRMPLMPGVQAAEPPKVVGTAKDSAVMDARAIIGDGAAAIA